MMFHTRRMWLLGVTLCCCLLVDIARADPRPDFAVNGQISGTAAITTLANESNDLFASISATVVTLEAGYGRLATVKDALDAIATQIASAGRALSTAIATLSANSTGPIATYFDAVTAAINTLRALISGGLQSQLDTITDNVDSFISATFTDSFRSVSTSLTTLTRTLDTMRTAVQKARTAAGNTNPIRAATMRQHVTTRIVSDVNNAVRLLKSDVPILVYIVKTTLSSLQTADLYLLGITDEATLRAQDVATIAATYGTDMDEYVTMIKTDITFELETPYAELQAQYEAELESTLTPVAGFGDQFDPLFQTLQTIFSDGGIFPGSIDTVYTAYIAEATALDDNLSEFYGSSVCTAVQNLIQVLIANGPNAQFCFSKFAQKVFNMFVINTYDTTDCYRLQMTRFERFHTGLLLIVQLMVHDIEDFIGHLETCTLLDDVAACTSYFGTEYGTLLEYTEEKRDYLERLLTKEADASLLRLAACFSNSKHLLILDAETMEAEIEVCTVNGPVVIG